MERNATDTASNTPPAQPAAVRLEPNGSMLTVHITGDAGLTGTSALELGLMKASALHAPEVVIDLSQLSFIGSMGLGQIVAFRSGVVRRGGSVKVVCPPGRVRDMLRSSGLEQLLNVCDSVDA